MRKLLLFAIQASCHRASGERGAHCNNCAPQKAANGYPPAIDVGILTWESPKPLPADSYTTIGTIRREYRDQIFFRNVVDPTRKLSEFRDYHIEHRVHRLLAGAMPSHRAGPTARTAAYAET